MRIVSRIEFKTEKEKDFYTQKAQELGYATFKDFAIKAMDEQISESKFEVKTLSEIAELACKLETSLNVESDYSDLSEEQKQAWKVAQLIYDLAINTDLMLNDKSNQVFVDDPLQLDGDDPHFEYKHPLTNFDIKKHIE